MKRRTNRILGVAFYVLSVVCFVLGIVFPILTTHKNLVLFTYDHESITLLGTVRLFVESRDYLLAGVIFMFTFLFPIIRYVELFVAVVRDKILKTSYDLDRFNMLDVFVVALLILFFKINSNFIVMTAGIGTAFIAFAVVSRILTSTFLSKQINAVDNV
ncbi:MAG: paraquat-inducible protein A [Mediterranea sp.]|jgi:uncharacterized paraquat-inducible protein A|nr:paraquat-inducible protein A [Mediterranea sp.]